MSEMTEVDGVAVFDRVDALCMSRSHSFSISNNVRLCGDSRANSWEWRAEAGVRI